MDIDFFCQFCSKLCERHYNGHKCRNHPGIVFYNFISDILMEVDETYDLEWYQGKLSIYNNDGFYVVADLDIPIVPPEQAKQLLDRILSNMVFA